MIERPRRLRANRDIREMVRETRPNAKGLILPLFLKEGTNEKEPIGSLDGHFHFTPDRIKEAIDESLECGVNKVLLFGIPQEKDEAGSGAYAPDGVVQQGIRAIRKAYEDSVYIITDVCMCEYTSHGHCGILNGRYVDNDKTLKYIAKTALSHAQAGADMVAPSDMMDGRVGAIRDALDENGLENTAIMSYAVKYASAFYGPFRDAAGSAPSFGDRKSYQMDCHNVREAVKEACLDEAEGADVIMVKPALSYLDVVAKVHENTVLPTAAYSVSGEYAMIKTAAKAGLVDEYGIVCESALSIFRAGADILISYYAKEICEAIRKGDI